LRQKKQSAAPAESKQPLWTPVMSGVFLAIVAFLAGLFTGSELLHHPVIAPPPPAAHGAAMGAASPDASPSSAAPAAGDGSAAAASNVPADSAALKASVGSTNDPAQLQALGEAHLDQDPATAVQAFEKAIKLGSASAAIYRGLGLANMRLQKYPDAMANLKKALVINPSDVTSVIAMGLIQEKTPGGTAEAKKLLQKALKMGPPESLRQSIQGELKKLEAS